MIDDEKTALNLFWAIIKQKAWLVQIRVSTDQGIRQFVGWDGARNYEMHSPTYEYQIEAASVEPVDYQAPTDLDLFNYFLGKLIPGSKHMTEAELMEAAMFYTANRLKALESGKK